MRGKVKQRVRSALWVSHQSVLLVCVFVGVFIFSFFFVSSFFLLVPPSGAPQQLVYGTHAPRRRFSPLQPARRCHVRRQGRSRECEANVLSRRGA